MLESVRPYLMSFLQTLRVSSRSWWPRAEPARSRRWTRWWRWTTTPTSRTKPAARSSPSTRPSCAARRCRSCERVTPFRFFFRRDLTQSVTEWASILLFFFQSQEGPGGGDRRPGRGRRLDAHRRKVGIHHQSWTGLWIQRLSAAHSLPGLRLLQGFT